MSYKKLLEFNCSLNSVENCKIEDLKKVYKDCEKFGDYELEMAVENCKNNGDFVLANNIRTYKKIVKWENQDALSELGNLRTEEASKLIEKLIENWFNEDFEKGVNLTLMEMSVFHRYKAGKLFDTIDENTVGTGNYQNIMLETVDRNYVLKTIRQAELNELLKDISSKAVKMKKGDFDLMQTFKEKSKLIPIERLIKEINKLDSAYTKARTLRYELANQKEMLKAEIYERIENTVQDLLLKDKEIKRLNKRLIKAKENLKTTIENYEKEIFEAEKLKQKTKAKELKSEFLKAKNLLKAEISAFEKAIKARTKEIFREEEEKSIPELKALSENCRKQKKEVSKELGKAINNSLVNYYGKEIKAEFNSEYFKDYRKQAREYIDKKENEAIEKENEAIKLENEKSKRRIERTPKITRKKIELPEHFEELEDSQVWNVGRKRKGHDIRKK